jgi:L-amino acid N-acyltransferase YncA
VIRPGRPGDVAAITALNTAYRLELAAAGHPEERTVEVWRPWLDRRISAGDVRVAVEEEAIVGYIAWELRRLPVGRALAVRDLYVRPGERGLRHGAGLLARALDRARADAVLQIEVTAGADGEASRGLLASAGFVPENGVHVRPIFG